ncbi:hypothetical protein RRG08_053995 [Elysia crispata]|uniref:Peptidase M13 C-terminal domain-containing protein n=1 Tax=Elysia crispata TaxID=231223 RepID=A0AAE1ECS6_9GAST|nr:hypothetical protein RRG08_053995 [Elysia crispata]
MLVMNFSELTTMGLLVLSLATRLLMDLTHRSHVKQNGTRSVGEIVADSFGLKQSYSMSKNIAIIINFIILSTLRNFPQFSQTFNCSLGSPMNPERKCSLFED